MYNEVVQNLHFYNIPVLKLHLYYYCYYYYYYYYYY
jgi:hypothetical protein